MIGQDAQTARPIMDMKRGRGRSSILIFCHGKISVASIESPLFEHFSSCTQVGRRKRTGHVHGNDVAAHVDEYHSGMIVKMTGETRDHPTRPVVLSLLESVESMDRKQLVSSNNVEELRHCYCPTECANLSCVKPRVQHELYSVSSTMKSRTAWIFLPKLSSQLQALNAC